MLWLGCAAPRPGATSVVTAPIPTPHFLPSETVHHPALRVDCPGVRTMAEPDLDPAPYERANWGGVNGAVDETGNILAWLEATDVS